MTDTAAKKDIQKLQRLIVDALEDVKAQDLKVFDTEHLSPLFERVIMASGTSNRQTKALAASVRDAVRDAGFDKPRTEGEENGEWIIVDCGQAVVHVMQPTIRQYYRLEEIWGEKPVRLKSGEAKAKIARAKAEAENAKSARAAAGDAGTTTKKAPAKKAATKSSGGTMTPAQAASRAAKAAKPAAKPATPAKKAAAKTPAAKKAAGKSPARKAAPKVEVVKVGAPAKKPAAKKVVAAPAKKAAAKKTVARKPAAKPAASRKA